MKSLERVLALNPRRILPAHGSIIEDPETLLRAYQRHRRQRELQIIDRSVSLPYWRFDQPAAALFTPDFLGKGVVQGPGTSAVVFSATNPLRFWKAGRRC